MQDDPNLRSVSLVAHALGDLRKEVMLVGGCAVGMLITDEARPPVRHTVDVDVVAEVASIADYYSLRPRLNKMGFKEDSANEHIFRWRKGDLVVDVLPTTGILGHSVNRWYAGAIQAAQEFPLPGGHCVNLITAPFFIATKLESFNSRGQGDYMHHDMEDILNVVDGREELRDEVALAPVDVREFIRQEIDEYLADPTFVDQLAWLFPHGRFELMVRRLRGLAGL